MARTRPVAAQRQVDPADLDHQLERTLEDAAVAARLAVLAVSRPAPRGRLGRMGRKGGVTSAVRGGRVGSRAWGWSMLTKRGGQALARHGLAHLRRISPLGVRARLIAAERKQARRLWEQEHGQGPGAAP